MHTLEHLQSLDDAQLARICFELGLAPEGYTIEVFDEGPPVIGKWADDRGAWTCVSGVWLPSRQENLHQTIAMARKSFGSFSIANRPHGDKRLYHGELGASHFMYFGNDDEESRCLTIAAILSRQAEGKK